MPPPPCLLAASECLTALVAPSSLSAPRSRPCSRCSCSRVVPMWLHRALWRLSCDLAEAAARAVHGGARFVGVRSGRARSMDRDTRSGVMVNFDGSISRDLVIDVTFTRGPLACVSMKLT